MLYTGENVKDFKSQLLNNKALLGIDYGEKRTGLAISDIRLSIASSLHIVAGKDIFKEINTLLTNREITGIVLGYPLLMNGSEGDMAKKVKEIGIKITKTFNLPVLLWDERLSSRAMENFLIKEADLSRKKRKTKLDSSAAAYILQGALDRLEYL